MLPDFVVIGAQKSGSTFLARRLAEHPDVYIPRAEVRFFEDPEYGEGNPDRLAALFRNAGQVKARGIKRPGYLARPEVAPRIRALLPQARLIAVLRDPVQRAVSGYFHLMRTGFLPIRPLETGLTAILDGAPGEHPRSSEVLDFGFYHRHLSHYLELFDASQLLVILLDDLRAEPERTMHQVYRFIGVDDHDPSGRAGGVEVTRNTGVYSPWRLRMLALANPLRYEYDAGGTRRRPRRAIRTPARLAARAIETLDRRLLAPLLERGAPRPDPRLRQRLFELYAQDIDRLESMLGRSLDAWRPGPQRR